MQQTIRRAAAALFFTLALAVVGGTAFAHGDKVKIDDYDTGKTSYPSYTQVTINSDNTITFIIDNKATTVRHGTIVYANGKFPPGSLHDFSFIPVDRKNPGYIDGGGEFKYANVSAGAPAAVPGAPKYTYHYIGGATAATPSLSTAAVRDDRGNLYVFPATAATLLANGKGFAVENQSFLITNDGGGLVAQGGGNIVAAGGGNLVAQGGGNLVAQGGGNLASAAIAALVAQGGGNLVAQGGGNLISNDGGGLISQGGAPMMMDGASFVGSGSNFRIMSFKDTSGKNETAIPPAMKQCSDARISYAYVMAASKTGNANISLHGDSGTSGRCNPASYAGGQYTPSDLVSLVQHSYDCGGDLPEIGQALFLGGYTPQAFTGCNAQHYYVNGQKWANFSDLRSRMTAYAKAFANGTENATKDKYGCVSPSLPVAVFSAQKLFFRNYDSVANLNKSLANSFTCSDKLANTTNPAYVGLYLGDPNNIPVALQLVPVVAAPAPGTAAAPANSSTAFDRPEVAATFCRVNNFGDVVRRDSITTSQLYGKPNYYTYYATSNQATYAPSQGSGSYYCMAFAQAQGWKPSSGAQSGGSGIVATPPVAPPSAYTVNRIGSGYYVIAGKEAWVFSPSQAVVSQERGPLGIPSYFTIGSGRFDLSLNGGNAVISHNGAPITALGPGTFDGTAIPSNNILTSTSSGTLPLAAIVPLLSASGASSAGAAPAPPAPPVIAAPRPATPPPAVVAKDKYGCTPGNYPVALFSSPELKLDHPYFYGNYAEANNLDISKANSFRCSDALPPGFYRIQPDNIPVVLQLRPPVAAVATPAPGAPPADSSTAFDRPEPAAAFCSANRFGDVVRRDNITTSKLYGKPNYFTYYVMSGQPGFASNDSTGSGSYYCTKFVQDKGWKVSPQPRP